MELYLIIIMLAICLILLAIILLKVTKPNDNSEQKQLKNDLISEIKTTKQDLQTALTTNLNLSQQNLNNNQGQVQKQLTDFNDKVNQNMHLLEVKMINSLQSFFQSSNAQLNQNKTETVESLTKLASKVTNDLTDFQNKLFDKVEFKMNQINDKVENRLNQGFKETNQTFKEIVERISKIDEAQRQIEKLSTEVVSLQDVLTDKKSRGIFGEIELKQILSSVYGEKNDKIYKLQYKLPNNMIADAILYTPSPLGMLVIDSKFPLENYRNMLDLNNSEQTRKEYRKLFKQDLKKHIDDIKNKYIIPDVTAKQACLFLPSEALFAEINAYHYDIVEYSYKANVWLTSPTTLMAFLTTIQLSLQNIERNKFTAQIHTELQKLSQEFARYHDRWVKLKKDIETVGADVNNIHTTSLKISNRFNAINQVEFLDKTDN